MSHPCPSALCVRLCALFKVRIRAESTNSRARTHTHPNTHASEYVYAVIAVCSLLTLSTVFFGSSTVVTASFCVLVLCALFVLAHNVDFARFSRESASVCVASVCVLRARARTTDGSTENSFRHTRPRYYMRWKNARKQLRKIRGAGKHLPMAQKSRVASCQTSHRAHSG